MTHQVFQGIRGDIENNNEQQANVASGPVSFWDEQNFGESVITDLVDGDDDEDFDDYRLRRTPVENIKLYKELLEDKGNKSNETTSALKRKSRADKIDLDEVLQCLYCYGSNSGVNITYDDENCYSGFNVPIVDCGTAFTRNHSECYTELHPKYIKRGCYDPHQLNVTFYCKCTLCNDKPADKREYFVYENINDWSFDNRRLQQPGLPGVVSACKYCNTTGATYFQTCMDGTSVEYTVCDDEQICFTQLDKVKGSVARGCADKGVYNSFYTFCNKSDCNDKNYWDTDVPFEYVKRMNRTRRLVSVPAIRSNTGRSTTPILLLVLIINLYNM
ncbi:uncharacterized protein LOC125229832 [Leguminivora glycinivorella]|uniref:uncharacterized protein LOC125229832 n=1 Tax=Leguminivora glycinivorella TaxID=1035111 RepID=UPI00200F0BEB|nr:uncharacterized protein LOC125229832 [Leguminivora glycinivorella]